MEGLTIKNVYAITGSCVVHKILPALQDRLDDGSMGSSESRNLIEVAYRMESQRRYQVSADAELMEFLGVMQTPYLFRLGDYPSDKHDSKALPCHCTVRRRVT